MLYKPVNTIIDIADLAEVIINTIVRYRGLTESMISDRRSLFTSKFWSLIYYFFDIKQKLFTIFYPQTDGQTK